MSEYKLKLLSEDEFIEKCRSGKCLRQTLKSKQCEKDSKKSYCYKKYIDKKTKEYEKEHTEKDYRWEQLKAELIIRDFSCVVTKILTNEEFKILEQQEDWWLSRFVDGAHLIPRSMASHIIYDIDNVILLNRHSHTRLDNFLDLVTGEFIGLEGKKRWIERIMHENKLWDLNYFYEDFYKDKMNTNKNLG